MTTERSHVSGANGLPVLAGFPVVQSVSQLRLPLEKLCAPPEVSLPVSPVPSKPPPPDTRLTKSALNCWPESAVNVAVGM